MIKIGLITEGIPDQAVLRNIINGYLSNQEYGIKPLRPDLTKDATDRKLSDDAAAGGLPRIKKDCEEGIIFDKFFHLDYEENWKIIIQVDTAEIEEYSVVRPKKVDENYTKILKDNVISLIKNNWLDNNYSNQLLFAISIEELEAWILALYGNKDTSISINPKKKLKALLSKKNISTKEDYNNYLAISKGFKKSKTLQKCFKHNESLKLFCDELEVLAHSSNTDDT